jgi:hypothetical protein
VNPDELMDLALTLPGVVAGEATAPAVSRPAYARPVLAPGERARVLRLTGPRRDCADCLDRQQEAHVRGRPAPVRRPATVRVIPAAGDEVALCQPCLADRGADLERRRR